MSFSGLPSKPSLAALRPQLDQDKPCDAIIHDVSAQEQRRLQELFKYFASTWQSTGYALNDIDVDASYKPQDAVLSSDPILNALTQLAAHRLDADRAFISIIDDEHQFVIAESTRELSLFDGSHHPPDGGLSIGARPLDLVTGVCAGTMPAFLDNVTEGPYLQTANVYADRTRYIINDFALEEKYKDRPYVTEWPCMRYYAEVPIRSGDHVLGTLAVIDNVPRTGITEEQFFALTEIAKTIMVHLEAVKTEQDHKQASKLLWGLNAFLHSDISGNDKHPGLASSFQLELPKNLRPPIPRHVTKTGAQVHARSHSRSAGEEATISMRHEDELPHSESSLEASTNISRQCDVLPRILEKSPTNEDTKRSPADAEREEGQRLQSATLSDDIRTSFSNAARILREAMDLDGVMFLDAGLTDFASRTDMTFENKSVATSPFSQKPYTPKRTPPLPAHGSQAENGSILSSHVDGPDRQAQYFPDISESTHAHSDSRTQPKSFTADLYAKTSGCLGVSIREHWTSEGNQTPPACPLFPELLHQSLLHHYPSGKVFDFNQALIDVDLSISAPLITPSFKGSRRQVMALQEVDKALRVALPNACAVVFVPLWHKESWFAGGLGWTSKDKRVLERDDLAYFGVFGTSIMAEMTRLDLVASDKAKSDFISSISHELRSPLHGILGTAELLKDGTLDPMQHQMMNMIEACGTTLLETVSHILEYAKISKNAPSTTKQSQQNAGTRVLDLAALLEDTVSAMLAGHRYSIKSAQEFSDASPVESRADSRKSDNDIVVVVDIEKTQSWAARTVSPAWRRIIMNLVGNSLKYTERGMLQVTLRTVSGQDHLEPGDGRRFVSLTVRDTGRGISKEFLQNQLFTPFVQEKDAPGAGLGLSIVQKIVQDLEGTIEVRSELGVGTEVDVIVPLEVVQDTPSTEPAPAFVGGSFLLVGFKTTPTTHGNLTESLPTNTKASVALQDSLANYAESWFQMTAKASSTLLPADIIAISLENLVRLCKADGSEPSTTSAGQSVTIPAGSSLLVICKSDDQFPNTMDTGRVQYLVLPAGPSKLRQLIRAALSADRSAALVFPLTAFDKDAAAAQATDRQQKRNEILMARYKARHPDVDMNKSPHTATEAALWPAATTAAGGAEDLKRKPPPCNLLIVDDNVINVKVLSSFAEKLSCSYTTATNGQLAVEAYVASYATHPFDYVLMDVNMPVLSGFKATRAIRDFEALHGLGHVPVVALTGLGSAEAGQEAFTSGMDVFLTKPVSLSKIRTLVEGGVEALKALQGN